MLKKLVLLIPIVFFLVLLELSARFYMQNIADLWYFTIDERNTFFHYDPLLGWAPNANIEDQSGTFSKFKIKTNKWGFRDRDHPLEKKSRRILVLGDSFVWGYGVDNSLIFTERLEAMDSTVEVINFGVSGYGTDQEYLLLQKHFDTFQPDVVILVVNPSNDMADNSSNVRYRGYFKPYFIVGSGERIELHGTPVPKSVRYYFPYFKTLLKHFYAARMFAQLAIGFDDIQERHIKDPTSNILNELRSYVLSKGSSLALGFTDKNEIIDRFCKNSQTICIDLVTDLRFSNEGNHWTPEGHRWVSEMIHKHYDELFGKF